MGKRNWISEIKNAVPPVSNLKEKIIYMAESLSDFCVIEVTNGDKSKVDIDFSGKHYLTSESLKFPKTNQGTIFLMPDLIESFQQENIKLKDIESFCAYKVIVSHEVKIDFGLLDYESRRQGIGGIPNTVIDTRKLAYLIYPDLKAYELEYLLSYANLPKLNSYLDDVAILFFHLCKVAIQKNIDVFEAAART